MIRQFTRLQARNRILTIVLLLVFAAIGVVLLLNTSAATPSIASEAELSQISTPATVVGDTAASNSKAVSFRQNTIVNTPPPRGGYFTEKPVGSWSSLPSGIQCTSLIHRSTWEPRPDNAKANARKMDAAAIKASLTSRPWGSSLNSQWDSWLMPRVDGQFMGTTDEIFQWAACKWGIPDDVIRAAANQESTWYQYLAYPSGRCVSFYGCGDFTPASTASTKVYCDAIAKFGYDYQKDYGSGLCPETFSILGIKSWWAPEWGQKTDNQNGAFPFNRESTAFSADYYGANLRGCYEGWVDWMKGTAGYAAGDLMGCVGHWFSGSWKDSGAIAYTARVQNDLNTYPWLAANWHTNKPGCHTQYGCPGPSPY